VSTTEIPAGLVKQLREETGAGMMDCKRALQETGGDVEAAKRLLRERGMAEAGKRAGRETTEGVVLARINDGVGTLVAVVVGVLERGLDALADQGAAAVETLEWILSSTSTECPASAAAGNVCPDGVSR